MGEESTIFQQVLLGLVGILQLFILIMVLSLTIKIGLQYQIKVYLPAEGLMSQIRDILSDRDIKPKKDQKLYAKLREDDDDLSKAKDVIRRQNMNEHDFAHLLVSMVGKKEILMRYIVVDNFCDPVLQASDLERIETQKKLAILAKHKKEMMLQAQEEEDLENGTDTQPLTTAIN